MSSDLGRFCWYDLMTTDPKAATDFYTKVIGWGTEAWDGGPMPYTMWKANRGPIGGVTELPEAVKQAGAPPHWIAYVAVDDVAAKAKEAVQLGGKIEKDPTEIPNAGTFAVLSDPQGAVFCIYKSDSDAPSPEGPPQTGEFSWHELNTSDHEAAWSFYEKLFGWEKTTAMDMGGDMGTYQMYGRRGQELGGMMNKPKEIPGPPFWLYYAKVDDVRQTVEKVKANGGRILHGPMEVPGGDWVAQCADPQGAAFAIHSSAKK
jgi:predicted enzyme related to lactoylglutathione lyase